MATIKDRATIDECCVCCGYPFDPGDTVFVTRDGYGGVCCSRKCAEWSHPADATEAYHVIRRDGRVYDRLDPDTHAIIQITRSYADDMSGTWTVEDASGEVYYCTETRRSSPDWPMAGP